jgi:hypothetical protein
MEPDGNVLGIDVLVAFMTAAAGSHALRHQKVELLLASLVLGALTEFGAIRFGGTHCHNAGLLNVAQCSSLNSVVFYGPWIYSSVVVAERLVGGARWALPWICGALTFGMCGVYETQGCVVLCPRRPVRASAAPSLQAEGCRPLPV